jgi:hypothetical protein
MKLDDAVRAVAKKGFTERQARFLVVVARHSGVCVMRQPVFSRCRYHARAQSPGTTAARALQDLRRLDELRDIFDRDRDKVRIVLLLSPT